MVTQEKQEKFLEAFVERRGVLDEAREDAGVTRGQFYTWMRNQAFKERFDNYRLALAEEIEGEAVARVLNPEGQRGSDALAATLLKGLKRERYAQDGPQAVGMQVVYVSALRDTPRPGLEGAKDVKPDTEVEATAVRADPIPDTVPISDQGPGQ